MVPTVLLVVTFVFMLMHIVPGDAVMSRIEEGSSLTEEQLANLRSKLGLDKPVLVQFGEWLWGVVRLDPGTSVATGRPTIDVLRRALPVSLELMILSQVISIAMAIPVGIISALKQDTWIDYVLRIFSISILSAPGFWIATMVIIFGSYWFYWAPPFGYAAIWDDPGKNLQQFVVPALIIGLSGSATKMRMARSAMLEVLRQDYVRTAKAKGLSGRIIIWRHVLKNAMIPVVTLYGGTIAGLLGGTVIIESIFALPGVGLATINAINKHDIPQLQLNVLFFGTVVSVVNLLIDLSYAFLDPRVRYG